MNYFSSGESTPVQSPKPLLRRLLFRNKRTTSQLIDDDQQTSGNDSQSSLASSSQSLAVSSVSDMPELLEQLKRDCQQLELEFINSSNLIEKEMREMQSVTEQHVQLYCQSVDDWSLQMEEYANKSKQISKLCRQLMVRFDGVYELKRQTESAKRLLDSLERHLPKSSHQHH